MKEFNIQNLVDSCLAKPGEINVRQEIFLIFDENPQTELIYIGDFNL